MLFSLEELTLNRVILDIQRDGKTVLTTAARKDPAHLNIDHDFFSYY